MTISVNTHQYLTEPLTVEYEPAHGFTYGPDDKCQTQIEAQVRLCFGTHDVTALLDIEDARAITAQLLEALAKHDIAIADYSVDLVKAVA
ncbi:hypothetical protein ACWDYH_29725 [Nocardia goodfellowii]